jgi:hypothetical protein
LNKSVYCSILIDRGSENEESTKILNSLVGKGKCKGTGKGKVIPVLFLNEHHAMMAYLGSGGITPRIL